MLAAMVPNSAKPFNFQQEFAMTEEMVRLGFHDLQVTLFIYAGK